MIYTLFMFVAAGLKFVLLVGDPLRARDHPLLLGAARTEASSSSPRSN